MSSRVIGIVSGKGGVGKTTLTANLGAALAKYFEKRVLIVDCNLTTSHLGLSLGIYYSPLTLNQLLKYGKVKKNLEFETYLPNLCVLPASISLKELKGVNVMKLRSLINKLKKLDFDFILLDSAPGLGREAMATLKASEEVIFVSNPLTIAAIDLIRLNEIIAKLGIVSIGLVLNMVRKKSYELKEEEIESFVNLPIIGKIPYDKNVLRALALKAPVVLKFPKSKASKAFLKVAERITQEKILMESEKSIYDILASKIRFLLQKIKKFK